MSKYTYGALTYVNSSLFTYNAFMCWKQGQYAWIFGVLAFMSLTNTLMGAFCLLTERRV